MSKDLNISMLMDFYGQLLTDKQSEALDFYYNQDFSLSEIAEELDISRQGVRDLIKRGEKQLTDMEDALGLARRFSGISVKINDINRYCGSIIKITNDSSVRADIEKILALTDKIINEV